MGLCSLVFTQLCLKVEPSESKTASAKTEFYMKFQLRKPQHTYVKRAVKKIIKITIIYMF